MQVSTPSGVGAPEVAAKPPRPWLVPSVVGAVVGVALAAWWLVLDEQVPCDPSTALSFGFAVLFLLGALATVGVGVVVQSQQARRRRMGRAMLLGAFAAAPPFLVLTWLLPLFIGPC